MKKLKKLPLYIGVVFVFSTPAAAYLDPGTGSIILQAVIGSVAAAMLFGRSIIHKVKIFFSKEKLDNAAAPSVDKDKK